MTDARLMLATTSVLTRTKSLVMREQASTSLMASPIDIHPSKTTVFTSMGLVLLLHWEALQAHHKLYANGHRLLSQFSMRQSIFSDSQHNSTHDIMKKFLGFLPTFVFKNRCHKTSDKQDMTHAKGHLVHF